MRATAIGICACGLAIAAATAMAGDFVLLKVQTIDKTESYRVISGEAFKAFEDQTELEARLYMKAEEMVRKEWREDESTRKEPFPSAALSAPKVTVVRKFPTLEEAEEKLKDYEERESRSEERKSEREKEQKKDKEKEAREKARDQEKQAMVKRATGIIETRIKELIDKQKAPAEGAGK